MTTIQPNIFAQLLELDPDDAIAYLDAVQAAQLIHNAAAAEPEPINYRAQLLAAVQRELGDDPLARFDDDDFDNSVIVDELESSCGPAGEPFMRRLSTSPSLISSLSSYSEDGSGCDINIAHDNASVLSSPSRYSSHSGLNDIESCRVEFGLEERQFKFLHTNTTYVFVGRCRAPSPFPADPIKKGGLGFRRFVGRLTRSWCRSSGRDGYEGLCRFFKWRKSPDGKRHPVPHKHDTLIYEDEAELHSGLSWAELMTAGGAAGVVADPYQRRRGYSQS